MQTKIFLNMQVSDLKRSRTFFEKLGYSFNARFSNDDAASLVISDTIHVMLHTSASFARFLPPGRAAADMGKSTEMLIAMDAESRDEVSALYDKAIVAGAKEARPAEDHGSMFLRSFIDPDGHIWEIFWMDPKAMQG